jgi:hypothetical protein
MRNRAIRVGALSLLILVITLATAWGVLALFYFDPLRAGLRAAFAALFGLFGCAMIVGICLRRSRKVALAVFAVGFAGVLACWSAIPPSNDRDWKPEVAVLPYATFEGQRVTVHNIRNFAYRSETDFTIAYYDRTIDLDRLDSIDLIASYWAGPAIAHLILSFGFADGPPLAISIERRDERSERYSAIKGLFRQYELIYVVADERDIIRLRTDIRRDPPEQVYLYRLRGERQNARQLLLAYLYRINSLRDAPEFYNTVTTNCSNSVWLLARVNPGHVPYSWKILLSGYVPEYLYELGKIEAAGPFADVQRRSRLDTAAMQADERADFSRLIRAALPDPESNRELP